VRAAAPPRGFWRLLVMPVFRAEAPADHSCPQETQVGSLFVVLPQRQALIHTRSARYPVARTPSTAVCCGSGDSAVTCSLGYVGVVPISEVTADPVIMDVPEEPLTLTDLKYVRSKGRT